VVDTAAGEQRSVTADVEVSPAALHDRVQETVGERVVGQEQTIRCLMIGLLAGGHVMLEGPPGVAKTTLARGLTRTVGLPSSRIQLTPDTLPADITGTQVYREHRGEFEFRKGPVFDHAVVADEINRATPEAQAALLEAMEERQVSADGTTRPLPDPFFLIATQNPAEMTGTYPLPQSQYDRFMLHVRVEPPDDDATLARVLERGDDPSEAAPAPAETPVSPGPQAMLGLRRLVRTVHVASPIRDHLLELHRAIEEHERVSRPPSPRALLGLQRAAQAAAALARRAHVRPTDVESIAVEALCHRINVAPASGNRIGTARELLSDILERTTTPAAPNEAPPETALVTDGRE
jgi:MoxR-like ATPase